MSDFFPGFLATTPTVDINQPITVAQPYAGEMIRAQPSATGGGSIFTAENLEALAEAAKGVSGLAAGIAGQRQAKAEARMAKMIARENANRIYRRLRAIADRGRAIAGAQGTTMAGNPMLTYESNLNEAELAAATEIFEGEGQALSLEEEGRQRFRKGIYDFGQGAVRAYSAMRPGTALLRRV